MEEVKLHLFEGNRILYVEEFTYYTKNSVRSNKQIQQNIKTTLENHVPFVYINNDQSKNEIKK